MAQTSIHVCPVKGGSEAHNERRKTLDYVRQDLTNLNERYIYPEFQHGIDAQLAVIKEDYETAHGKRLHAKATPIREAVVVIQDATTMDQLKEFCTECKEKWGIQAMQIYTHRDEGHTGDDGNWKPNLHAHIVYCWYNTQTHTTCKLSRQNMAEMQTLLAKCLGMERGVSSDKKHLTAIQQRIAATEEQLEELETKKTDLQATQKATDKALRDCCRQLQHIGKNTVKNYDTLCSYNAVKPTKKEQKSRDSLAAECCRELPQMRGKELISEEALLRNLIHYTSNAVERIGKKLQRLAKDIPWLKRRRLAHEAELQAAVETAESNARASAEDAQIATDMAEDAKAAANRAEAAANDRERKARDIQNNLQIEINKAHDNGYRAGIIAKDKEWNDWYENNDIGNLQDKIKELQDTKASWLEDFRSIAKKLTSLNAESITLLEQMGLRDAVGTKIWDEAKKTKIQQEQQQQRPHSRGRGMH